MPTIGNSTRPKLVATGLVQKLLQALFSISSCGYHQTQNRNNLLDHWTNLKNVCTNLIIKDNVNDHMLLI